MEKDHQIVGIRAIIEAIQAGATVDKVYIQIEASSELMKDLIKMMKRGYINFSYVPVEKLNRLTPNNHQGPVATISPIPFFDLETFIESVIKNGKKTIAFGFSSDF
jgi:23S rRNA (guanosine2251-2'-O)-methyltransferase